MFMEMETALLPKLQWMMFRNNIYGILYLEDYGRMHFFKQLIILLFLQQFVYGISVRMIKVRVERDLLQDQFIEPLDII